MNNKPEENINETLKFLLDEHQHMLREESGISQNIIVDRGYRTITDAKELLELGFVESQLRDPGLLLPVHAPDATTGLYQYRPDNPRLNNENGKPIKYETISGAKMRIDSPPICRPKLSDPKIPIWITEGIKKGDALASHDLCAIALLGVWNFKGKNDFGGVSVLADLDFIAWNDREVRIVFDSDIVHKTSVRKAMERLKEILERKGAKVSIVYLPDEGDSKSGVDDYLLKHSVEDLEKLVSAPKPKLKPKDPEFIIMDELPLAMRRPLQIIENRAYTAKRIHVKKIETETVDENDNVVQLNPPKETISPDVRVIRDDGKMFGLGTDNSIHQLGFDIFLPDSVPGNRLIPRRQSGTLKPG